MKLPADLLARPAEEAVRRLALAQLERAAAAREQLVAGDRDEALHDFRVALRRLRSLLRSHRASFSVEFPRKALRRVAALARDTNPGRDAEVQLAWLASFAGELAPAQRAGHRELSNELAQRRDECYRKVEREIVRDFTAIAGKLASRLAAYRVAVDLERPARPASFAVATRDALGPATEEFLAKLAAIETAADETAGHAARIAAKRLRYLLEPVAPWLPAARRPIELLKDLQDLLGELHDGQLLAAHVGQSLAEIESKRAQRLIEDTLEGTLPTAQAPAKSRRRERAGLIAVARMLGSRRSQLFARLAAEWLAESAPSRQELAGELAGVASALAEAPRRRTGRQRRSPPSARRNA